jgi:hypothetical protein
VFGLLFALCFAPPSAAAQDQKRVVVMPFKGPGAPPVQKQFVAALKARSEVRVLPEKALKGPDKRKAAARAQVSAFIEGRVAKKGKLIEVLVSVRDADSGEVVHEERWLRKKPQLKTIKGSVWDKLGSYILGTHAPAKASKPEPEPEPESEPEPEPEPVAAPPPKRTRPPPPEPEPEPEPEVAQEETAASTGEGSVTHPALVLSLGPRFMWRSLAYQGSTTLSSYSSYGSDGGTPAFNLAISAAWFPGAHRRSDWLSDFGLEGDIDYSIGLKSKQNGKELSTTAYEFAAGALYRIPLDMFEPRVRVGYVKHTFDVDVPTGTPLPAVSYSAVRLGAGAVVNLVEAFGFDLGFGYLIVLDAGEIGSATYASKLSSSAWEIGGGATVRFKQRFGIRMSADFRRYQLDFGDSTNAMWVLPKTATDDYLRATLSFLYLMPGKK